MNVREFLQVDPATLHLPGGRRDGVDPMKPEATRSELLDAIAELVRDHPNWRLGQLMSNLAMAAGRLEAGGCGTWRITRRWPRPSSSCSAERKCQRGP